MTNLVEASLAFARLTRANLTAANLADAYLGGADLTSADLTSANLSRATVDEDTLWYKAVLTEAKVEGVSTIEHQDVDPNFLTSNRFSEYWGEAP